MSRMRVESSAYLATALMSLALGGCKRSDHPHVASFVRPPLPAGFAEQAGDGWRVVTPSTWHDPQRSEPGVWSSVDPQPVGDFRASVNVVTEPFPGESYAYAKASVEELRRDPRATVETAREEVVDGDPTLIVQSRWSAIAPSTVPYRTMQANLASRGTGYVVTCSVSADAFERYRSTCEAIVHSFAVER
jgi:hypothetical protein